MIEKAATISPCTCYRYSLRRTWQPGGRVVCFIMLNPSTADAEEDDPTIRRCIGFGKSWNFDALEVVNVFAYRTTNPSVLAMVTDPEGPENDAAIQQAAGRAEMVVCAWGAHEMGAGRAMQISAMLKKRPLYCLGMTKTVRPKHPLYVSGDQQPILWRGALL